MTSENLSNEQNPCKTIKDLAASWLDRITNRRRKPCKPATLSLFSYYIANHINPLIGNVDVEAFQNKKLRDFAEAVVAKGLAPKTCHELIGVVQQIIKSAQDADGNALYVRNWNRDFILENVSDVRDQHQPMVTKEQLKDALKLRHTRTDKYRIIVVLLCATGIRVGELVALRVGDDHEHSGWDQDNSLLAIRTSFWNGAEQKPKTQSSIRLVDLSQPVNAMVAAYVKANNKNPGDHLFATSKGTPFAPTSLRKHALVPLGIPGFHSLRRWRISWLRTNGCPDPLLKLWVGHSNGKDITARYDKSTSDKEWRQTWADRLGVGEFDLPTFLSGDPRPPITKSPKIAKSPKPDIRNVEIVVKRTLAPKAKRPKPAQETTEPYVVPYKATDDDLDSSFFAPPVQEQL